METISLQSPARNLLSGLVIDHDNPQVAASCRVSANGRF